MVGLVGLVGWIGLVGLVGWVGFVGLLGWIGLVGVELVGLVEMLSLLVNRSGAHNHLAKRGIAVCAEHYQLPRRWLDQHDAACAGPRHSAQHHRRRVVQAVVNRRLARQVDCHFAAVLKAQLGNRLAADRQAVAVHAAQLAVGQHRLHHQVHMPVLHVVAHHTLQLAKQHALRGQQTQCCARVVDAVGLDVVHLGHQHGLLQVGASRHDVPHWLLHYVLVLQHILLLFGNLGRNDALDAANVAVLQLLVEQPD